MTIVDHDALDALNCRLQHVADTATFLAEHAQTDEQVRGALRVLALALGEARDSLAEILAAAGEGVS